MKKSWFQSMKLVKFWFWKHWKAFWQRLKFVIEDSTITNLTAEDYRTDVTGNNPTATFTLTAEDSTTDVEKDNDESQIPLLERLEKWKVWDKQHGLWLLDHTHSRNIGEKWHFLLSLQWLFKISAISEHEFGED